MLRSKSICKVFETNPCPQSPSSTDTSSEKPWFDYVVRVSPHHTDYGGIVWHGTYITWMEESRIEQLRLTGLEYHTLVEMGCELPVVELNIRYYQAVILSPGFVIPKSNPQLGNPSFLSHQTLSPPLFNATRADHP